MSYIPLTFLSLFKFGCVHPVGIIFLKILTPSINSAIHKTVPKILKRKESGVITPFTNSYNFVCFDPEHFY